MKRQWRKGLLRADVDRVMATRGDERGHNRDQNTAVRLIMPWVSVTRHNQLRHLVRESAVTASRSACARTIRVDRTIWASGLPEVRFVLTNDGAIKIGNAGVWNDRCIDTLGRTEQIDGPGSPPFRSRTHRGRIDPPIDAIEHERTATTFVARRP